MALNALELEFSCGLGSTFSLQGADMGKFPYILNADNNES